MRQAGYPQQAAGRVGVLTDMGEDLCRMAGQASGMRIAVAGNRYHRPSVDCNPNVIGGKMQLLRISMEEMIDSGKDICEECFPELVE